MARHVLRTAPQFLPYTIPATVNGAPGALWGSWEEPLSVLGFTVVGGKIAAMHLVTDRAKLQHMRQTFTPPTRSP